MSERALPSAATVKALFSRGRYNELLLALHRAQGAHELPAEYALLAATALTRTGRPQEALAGLRSLENREDYSTEVALHAHLLESVAELALGNMAQSEACIQMAADLVARAGDADAPFQVKLYRAVHAWAERDIVRAEMLARAAMASSNGTTYASAAQIVGFSAASRGQYLEQLSILENTLHQLDRLQHEDVWLEASILQNISGVIADFHLPAVARRLAERTESIDWTDETAVALYHILRALAYSRSFGSDALSAFDYLERAENVIPSEGWELVSRLDRVLFIDDFGGRRLLVDFDAEAEIRRAEEIANALDWTHLPGEERLGLLMLAELLAERRPRDAEMHLQRYRSTKEAVSHFLMARSDARWSAYEDYVDGLIAAASGMKQRAVELIGRAFDFWVSVGYSWRATRATLKLYELTGERRHIEWASREADAYPLSWIGEAVRRAAKRRPR